VTAEIVPLAPSIDEDRAVLDYLRRECAARGWDLADLLDEAGFAIKSYVCPTCDVPPLLMSSPQVVELDGRRFHRMCRSRMMPWG
jgi:hypothetical protein